MPDSLLRSKLPPSSPCSVFRACMPWGVHVFNTFYFAKARFSASSSPSCWLGCQTTVISEGDVPDHHTFCHRFVLQENKRNFRLQKMYFWNRPWNSSQTSVGLQPAPVQSDCTECTFKSLGAESRVGVSSCSLQGCSKGSHSHSTAWFCSWWHPQTLQRLVPCCILWKRWHTSQPTSTHSSSSTGNDQPGQPLGSRAWLGSVPRTRCRGVLRSELNYPLPSWQALRRTDLLLPLLSVTLVFLLTLLPYGMLGNAHAGIVCDAAGGALERPVLKQGLHACQQLSVPRGFRRALLTGSKEKRGMVNHSGANACLLQLELATPISAAIKQLVLSVSTAETPIFIELSHRKYTSQKVKATAISKLSCLNMYFYYLFSP